MNEQNKSKTGTVILVIVVIILAILLIKKNAETAIHNEGKNYKDVVYTNYGDCDKTILGTIEQYGDDRGYYCYKTTDTYGKTIWKVGNAYKD